MATAGAETVEVASQRAELQSVLSSQAFMRAPRLAHLLSYLCEKLFAGEAGQIKEFSLALEGFNRGTSFDQDSDSIVRVEANRLRKRLAEYYAGEGASHELQITIPVGQYVPRFELRRMEPDQKQAVSSAVEQPVERRNWSGLPWTIGAGIATLAIVAVGTTYLATRHRSEERAVSSADAARVQGDVPDGHFGPPAGEEIRILAGASRSLVEHAGKLWSADAGFSGGSAVKSTVQHVGRTLESGFYRTSRQGQFRYDIALKSGMY